MTLTPYCSGKFDFAVDAWLYDRSMEGCDDQVGDVLESGLWHGILRGLTVSGPFADLTPAAREKHYLSAEDVAWIAEHSAGAIIQEDSQGFVQVEWYHEDDAQQMEDDWTAILTRTDDESEVNA